MAVPAFNAPRLRSGASEASAGTQAGRVEGRGKGRQRAPYMDFAFWRVRSLFFDLGACFQRCGRGFRGEGVFLEMWAWPQSWGRGLSGRGRGLKWEGRGLWQKGRGLW